MNNAVERIVETFRNLTPAGVELLGAIYESQARFKDPFNEVQGLAEIQRIFRHMYVTLNDPHFLVTGCIVQGSQCFLAWEFRFSHSRLKGGREQCIRGGSHLVLSESGRIVVHRDYWDAAEEVYEKLPVVGSVMRWLKRQARP